MHTQTLYLLIYIVLITGCAQTSRPETIRVCDSTGCSNRPANSARFDTSKAGSQSDPEQQRLEKLEALAEKDPRAAYDLGLRYFRGDGVHQDSYKALQWMRDAAERGNLDAQKAIGRLYLTGLEEMGSDPREAQKWLSIAASRGDKEAAILLEEADQARVNEETYYRWSNRWRPIFYRNWYYNYPYQWQWYNNGWYPYRY